MTTALRPFDLDTAPFAGGERLFNVVAVEFDTSFHKIDCNARELFLAPSDRVVVETSRGPLVATVRAWPRRVVRTGKDLPQVLRRATTQDEDQVARNREAEVDAYRFAIGRINARKLDMKLIRAEWMVDGSRLVFYFSAEGRVDFRDLVKDLAHRFRTRIEMHQIGVRDGTGMIGGIGPCGRELCCSTFLQNFAPVSIRMAKDQGLSLNPAKVSGMCGRLMCCLVYEQQVYRSMRKRLPRANAKVRTRFGDGKVVDVDVINQRVQVDVDGSRHYLDAADVIVGTPAEDDGYVDTPGNGEPLYDWDDVFGAPGKPAASDEGGKPKKKGRRRRGGRKRGGGAKGGGDKS